MLHNYFSRGSRVVGLFFWAWLLAATASAQAPAWSLATTSSPEQLNGSSSTIDVATDASGNVFVTGYFDGQVTFGTTTLTSAGQIDFFVAKYVPATNTWAWAQRGGGTRNDVGQRLVVSGSSIYLTGYLTNSLGNGSGVYLGGTTPDNSPTPQSGCSVNDGQDLFVAKYIDQGTSAALAWSQAAGGTGADIGYGIAVSGSSVYVTGTIFNNTANANSVVFGSSGLAAGTLPQPGASPTASPDLVLARYTDQGASATVAWVQVGGGTGADIAYGVAASGSRVYVTGSLVNTSTNANGVLLGGTGATPGTVPQYGASPTAGPDLLLAKYTDAGPSASLTWTQVGGGTGEDMGNAVAVSAGSVYVVGTLTNNFGNGSGVLFGGSGTTAGTVLQSGVGTSLPNANLVLAKYTDNGPSATVAWTQVGGGTSSDAGRAIAVSGSSLYVVGTILNDQANTTEVVFGGSGTVAGTSVQAGASGQSGFDLVVAKYTDQGPSAAVNWTQVGGGTTSDYGYGVAASGGSVYVAGLIGSYTGLFGTAAGSPLLGCRVVRAVLGQLSDNGTAGPWQRVVASFNGGLATTTSTATDASGNVFVAGYFDGQLRFGSTLLSSAGSTDAFVAKYVPATGTWAWAQSAGGVGADQGQGLAVSGGNVYLTGFIDNNSGNGLEVGFGGTNLLTRTSQQPGATSTRSFDLFVAKYTDDGLTATLGWTQVGGGTGWDQGYALAVSGSSVYMAGSLTNNKLDGSGARFGGSGLVLGTVPQYGAASTTSRDMLLAKYTDNGPTATLNWTQVAGGTDWDEAYALAVGSGGSVYVAGTLYNSLTNANQAVFGGAGTVLGTGVQHGASPAGSYDVVLAKYTDNGPSATVAWTQVGGGTNVDYGYGVAVSGNRLYVTGSLINTPTNTNGVLFGGSGTVPGTAPQYGVASSGSPDLLLAKYTDNGPTATLGWTQVAGGTGSDYGTAVVASGSNVYVAGALTNSRTNSSGVQFGGSGTTPGTVVVSGAAATTSRDVLVARYVDTGPSATVGWAQVGGGAGLDIGYGIALAGPSLYVAGSITPAATFGTLPPLGTSPSSTLVFLGSFDGSATLATTAATAGPALSLFPNPAAGQASLRGAPAGVAVSIFDALGRRVATATANARGTAALPGGLRPGVYVVRAGTSTARWVVE